MLLLLLVDRQLMVDRLTRLTRLLGEPNCLGSSDHHFPQPTSLLTPLSDSDYLCLQLHHPDYLHQLGHPGLLPDLGHHGPHRDYLGHPGLHHPEQLDQTLVHPDCLD